MDKLLQSSHDWATARFLQGPKNTAIRREDAAILKLCERETLLDVIESVCDIRNVDGLRRWSQTYLQKVLPHKIVICGLADVIGEQLRLKPILLAGVSGCMPVDKVIGSSLNVIATILTGCTKQAAPQLIADHELPNAPVNVRALLGNIGAHGVLFDITGSGSFVAVCQMLEQPDMRHAHALKLLSPHLHVVLKRVCGRKKSTSLDISVPQVKLSCRETEVLRWLREGKRSSEVAQLLNRSPHTVRNQMRNIYSKLRASNKAQALFRATELALFD